MSVLVHLRKKTNSSTNDEAFYAFTFKFSLFYFIQLNEYHNII